MHDVVIALVFVVMVASPAFVAALPRPSAESEEDQDES